MAPPVSAGYQARIGQLETGLAGLPSIFNPQRRSLAFGTAAGLNESGLTYGLTPEESNDEGNLTYRLVRGADGRLYSQAHRSIGTQYGAKGSFFSSYHQRAQRDARRDLDTQRNAAIRGFGTAQEGIQAQQAAEDRRLRGDLGTARGEYADWQGPQPVPDPGAPAAPAAPTQTSTPGAPGYVSEPGMFGVLHANRAGNLVTGFSAALSPPQRKVVQAQYPGFRLVRAGNGMLVLKR